MAFGNHALHQRVFFLDQQHLTAIDHPHPVGDRLGFLNIMCCQDDGHTILLQLADDVPHILAQFDIDTSSRFIPETGSVAGG